MAEVVETARLRPGHCVLSGETQGPFIDTGKNVPRYGRVYISLKWLEQPLREIDYLTPDKAEDLTERNEELEAEVSRLLEIESDHQTLIENIQQYVPTPEAEVREVMVTKYRKPSDEEIEEWVEKFGGNHPAVRNARPPEKGSYEEWSRLYGESGPQRSEPEAETLEEEVEEEGAEEVDDGPDRVVTVHDQDVNLDEVLAENVGDVIAFAEGKGEEFEEALVRREHFLAEKNERDPRKGVLAPLGYWDDEDDEPLYPADEEDEETEQEEESESDEEEETLSLEDDENEEDES